MRPCTLPSETWKFKNITTQLENANANTIYELTGCLASCERNEYEITDVSFTTQRANECQGGKLDLHLEFEMSKGSYKEEEQYFLYDYNSFIADVGGFLGLLLGYSMLGIYDEFEILLMTFKHKSLLK